MGIPEGSTWLLYVDVFGTIAVLTVFGYLFWTGRIMSKATVDRIVEAYKEQAALATNGFLTELRKIAEANGTAATAVSNSVLKWSEEARLSRAEMTKTVTDIRVQLTRIEAGANGKTTARRKR